MKRVCSARGQVAGTNECGNMPSGSMRGELAGLEKMSCTNLGRYIQVGAVRRLSRSRSRSRSRRKRRKKKCRRQCGTAHVEWFQAVVTYKYERCAD